MSPARILFQTYLDAERRIEDLHDAAVAARSAGAKKESFEKFLKSLGGGDAA